MNHAFWFGYEVEKSRRADIRSVATLSSGRRHKDHPQQEAPIGTTWSHALRGERLEAEPAEQGRHPGGRQGLRRHWVFWR
jgi:hypothetical protein